jgi:hypothetical protein
MIASPPGSFASRITAPSRREQSPASSSNLEFLQGCQQQLEDAKAEHKRVIESRIQKLKLERAVLESVEQQKRKASQSLESSQPRRPFAERITSSR